MLSSLAAATRCAESSHGAKGSSSRRDNSRGFDRIGGSSREVISTTFAHWEATAILVTLSVFIAIALGYIWTVVWKN
jgi:hypothetical protein